RALQLDSSCCSGHSGVRDECGHFEVVRPLTRRPPTPDGDHLRLHVHSHQLLAVTTLVLPRNMRRSLRGPGLVATVLLQLLATGAVAAQATTGALAGTVTAPDGTPVANVRIVATPGDARAVTSTAGRYRVDALPVGRVVVSYRRLGFAARVDTVVIAAGQTARLDVRLAQGTVLLPALSVRSAKLTVPATEVPQAVATLDRDQLDLLTV
nr:carboxypeptidase-like regulatory domain-containing protein [Gemmatimonadaceae bacterium]